MTLILFLQLKMLQQGLKAFKQQPVSMTLSLCRKLRPSMMQHLLRRLVFDIPLLNEHTKMPLKVRIYFFEFQDSLISFFCLKQTHLFDLRCSELSDLLNE